MGGRTVAGTEGGAGAAAGGGRGAGGAVAAGGAARLGQPLAASASLWAELPDFSTVVGVQMLAPSGRGRISSMLASFLAISA